MRERSKRQWAFRPLAFFMRGNLDGTQRGRNAELGASTEDQAPSTKHQAPRTFLSLQKHRWLFVKIQHPLAPLGDVQQQVFAVFRGDQL